MFISFGKVFKCLVPWRFEKYSITYVFKEQNLIFIQSYGVPASKRQCSDVDDICSICQAEFQKPILLICQVTLFLSNLNTALPGLAKVTFMLIFRKKYVYCLAETSIQGTYYEFLICDQGFGRLAKFCPLCSNGFYVEVYMKGLQTGYHSGNRPFLIMEQQSLRIPACYWIV